MYPPFENSTTCITIVLIYNLKIILLSTGSITITAASVSNVQRAVEMIYPLVEPFQKPKTKQDLIDPVPEEFEQISNGTKRKRSASPLAPKSKPNGLPNFIDRRNANQFGGASGPLANSGSAGPGRSFQYVPKKRPVLDSDSDENSTDSD